MKQKLVLLVLGFLSCLFGVGQLLAQTDQKPVIQKFSFPELSIVFGMSDNGKWAVAMPNSSDAQSTATSRVVNVDTGESVELLSADELLRYGGAELADVTDDGEIVVGSHQNKPAYWTRSTGKWTYLSVPTGWAAGIVRSVTPDGRYMLGNYMDASLYKEKGFLYDRQEDKYVEMTGHPTLDMLHENVEENRLLSISASGSRILGTLSHAYPDQTCAYVYDVQANTYKMIGFKESTTGAWTPLVSGLAHVEWPVMSSNGRWITGVAYMVKESASSNFPDEYPAVFRYDADNDLFELYDDTEDAGLLATTIDDNGNIYACSPFSSPLREWSVRYGNYWYPLSQILSQKYGIDFYSSTNYERTGTVVAVNADGSRIASFTDPQGESYVAKFPQPVAELCAGINLLSTYTVTPESGMEFSKLRGVEVLFDRNVEVTAAANAVKLKDAAGNVVLSSLQFEAESGNAKNVLVSFRTYTLKAGETYTVEIPAGSIALKGDRSRVNDAITLTYIGRDNNPVKLVAAYPTDGSQLAKIDLSESPVQLYFDSRVAVSDTASGRIVRVDDGVEVASLAFTTQNKVVYAFPLTTQYLYDGVAYRLEVDAGSVTTAMGEGPNEAIALNYTGTYVREISHDDENLFTDDFSNPATSQLSYLLYEGDHNEPVADMAALAFDADNTPWNFTIRETTESTDFCAASHSSYTNGGASDDWMVIPQLYLPDEWCELSFDMQGYSMLKQDKLKVLVWSCDEVFSYISTATAERFKAEGVVVLDEIAKPGLTQDGLEDEWTHKIISLADFAGKNVYIAFVNQNENQSLVFVDNIKVRRNLKYLLSLDAPTVVVGQNEQAISGRLVANSDDEVFDTLTLTLTDGEGNAVDQISATGLSLKKGDVYPFTFGKPLNLEVGKTCAYTIKVEIGPYTDDATYSIKNLAFEPTRRVVVEEITGLDCGNCPLGILAIENMEHIYGDRFIPISIHTYSGDPLGSGLTPYTNYLGIQAAPTGVVNREGEVTSPMWQNPADKGYYFSNSETHDTWLDRVSSYFETLPDADIDIAVNIDKDAGTFSVPVNVRYALDAEHLNLNLFAVVLEDNLVAYQQNYYSQVADENLGEWGLGGRYAEQYVRPYAQNDVARSTIGATFAGTGGYLPQAMKAGETYTATITAPLPTNLANRGEGIDSYDYAKVVVMLIDANTGRVVNAARAWMNGTPAPDAIGKVETEAAKVVRVDYYGLDGRKLSAPVAGVSIERATMSDGTVRTRKVMR